MSIFNVGNQGTNAQVSITGADDIKRRLKLLPEEMQKKALGPAARKGMKIVRDTATRNAASIDDPKTPNNIAKNIIVQRSGPQSKRVGGLVLRVGVRGGARKPKESKEAAARSAPGGATWYWRFLEFGTAHSRARPFLQEALSSNVEAVTTATTNELSKQIDKIAKKLNATKTP